jgi:hypothetical protein
VAYQQALLNSSAFKYFQTAKFLNLNWEEGLGTQVLEGPLFPGWNRIKSGCFMPRTRIP